MKNRTILFVLLLTATQFVVAQEGTTDNRELLQLGVKGGLNYSNVYDEQGEEFNADAKYGYAVGAFLNIPIGKYLGVQPSVLLSQKGFQASGRLLGAPYNFIRTTTFIDVPLLIAFKPSEFLTVLAGPQYSYLVRQKDEFRNGTGTVSQINEFENDNIRKNIFGIAIGADVNIKHFSIGGRLNWDVQNNNGDGSSTTPRYKNGWFQATLGYAF